MAAALSLPQVKHDENERLFETWLVASGRSADKGAGRQSGLASNPMNTLIVSLPKIGPIAPANEGRRYDQDLDNVTSLLIDICDALAEEASVRFVVSGFGQDPWPVDVRTDLPVVIEQVPAALAAIRNGAGASLGFYEQGIQRVLAMDPSGYDEVIVECQSMTSWQPQPSTVRMKRQDILDLLGTFLREFVEGARQRCPDLVEHAWFREWIRDG